MALQLPGIKQMFQTSKERKEGISARGQFTGKQIISGYSNYVLNPNEGKSIPINGTDSTGAGGSYRIPSDCEISEIKVEVGTNTFDTSNITYVMYIADKDNNLLKMEVFFLFTPGTTGIKKSDHETYYIPKDGQLAILLISSAGGAGTATNFRFSAVINILK